MTSASYRQRYTFTAIPTIHEGVRYRSRLEARWAIFLRALAIDFRYEPRKFTLRRRPKRLQYTPDFYLPEYNVWLEIKGPKATQSEKDKLAQVVYLTRAQCGYIWGPLPSSDHWQQSWKVYCVGGDPVIILPMTNPRRISAALTLAHGWKWAPPPARKGT